MFEITEFDRPDLTEFLLSHVYKYLVLHLSSVANVSFLFPKKEDVSQLFSFLNFFQMSLSPIIIFFILIRGWSICFFCFNFSHRPYNVGALDSDFSYTLCWIFHSFYVLIYFIFLFIHSSYSFTYFIFYLFIYLFIYFYSSIYLFIYLFISFIDLIIYFYIFILFCHSFIPLLIHLFIYS